VLAPWCQSSTFPASTTSNFSGDVLADIYLGKIARWDDPRIAKTIQAVNFSQVPEAAKKIPWSTAQTAAAPALSSPTT